MIRINGKAYSWADVDVAIPGLSLEVQEISYDDEAEKEAVYGRGQAPRGYSEGNYKSSGKVTVLLDDFGALIDYANRQGVPLYKLVIPKIIVSYANEGDRTRSDVLQTVTITKVSQKAAQGDKTLTVELDLLIVHGIIRDGLAAI